MAERGEWGRMLLLNAGGALLAFGIALGSGTSSWHETFLVFFQTVVYTTCVSGLARFVQPPILRRLGSTGARGFVARVAGTVLAIAAGLTLGAAVLVATGVLQARDLPSHAGPLHWPLFVYPTMLIVSLGSSYYLTMSRDLARTTLALRTKERDEALARQQAAEAQLAALEARVQPHFLFNTLNSIAALIPEDAEGAERMVERVAALMRSSLQQDGPSTAPLGDELRLVRDYLEIERVRFRERLRYEVRVSPELEHVAVPRLSVQTLAENAVKYAVAPQRAGATIVIAAAVTGERASVTVSDDGPGFAAGVMGEGHGLHLLRSRLASVFGDKGTLRIESRPGATSCVMEVPVR